MITAESSKEDVGNFIVKNLNLKEDIKNIIIKEDISGDVLLDLIEKDYIKTWRLRLFKWEKLKHILNKIRAHSKRKNLLKLFQYTQIQMR